MDERIQAGAGVMWRVIKRLMDVVVSTIGLVAVCPILVLIALLVKLTSRGPVFFKQERVGRCFRVFQLLKFRTMVPEAPRLGGQITAGADPRITPVGHFLRRTKLDELPQLWNVLVGDMSFVGPRPEVPKYVTVYKDQYEELLAIRPGITDLASLKYRHESDLLGQSDDPERTYIEVVLPDKIELGREYIRRSSFLFDLGLILKTVRRMAE